MSSAAEEPAPHHRRVLFTSGEIAVVDFRCREHGDREGPEEPNPTHSIALVRRGVFRRTERGRALVADANHILFFNEAHPYRYSHPIAGGDDCTILTIATPSALELVAHCSPRHAERPELPFRMGHAVSSPRTRRLHYELLRASRHPSSELVMEDALAELAGEAVRDAYAMHDLEVEAESLSPLVRRRRREVTEAAKVVLNRRLESPPSLRAISAVLRFTSRARTVRFRSTPRR